MSESKTIDDGLLALNRASVLADDLGRDMNRMAWAVRLIPKLMVGSFILGAVIAGGIVALVLA